MEDALIIDIPQVQIKKEDRIYIPESDKPRVVIIGGGFGGIQMVKNLRRKRFQVVLIDRHNYHTFQPLLYQVATAGLEPDSIAEPLRKALENDRDFFFRMAALERIEPESRIIHTNIGYLEYDFLIIASGSVTNYFGNEEIKKNTFPLKQIPQALDLRSHILQNFEKAVLLKETDHQLQFMNFVIVGGGPTGVEIAGALGELKKSVLPKDYPELDLSKMKIILIEGKDNLLVGMDSSLGEKAIKYLKKFDVEVKLDSILKSYDGNTAILSDGSSIETQTVIWAAGVNGNIPKGLSEESVERSRLLVDEYNKVIGYHDIYAIGDIAFMKTDKNPHGHPMLAQVAMQQGKLLAKNLYRLGKGKSLTPFEYKDLGSMATIGRNKAVVQLPGLKFGGLFAWIIWMFVHLFSIIGFRNKLVVFSNWVWNYFTYDRGIRLIIRPFIKAKSSSIKK
jgi:NADH dehydrogenase